jgi:hypothetical protein
MMYSQSSQRGETKQILKEPLNDSNSNLSLNTSGNITIQSNNNLNAQSSITIQSNNLNSVPSSRAPNPQANPINISQAHQQQQQMSHNFLTNSGTFVNTMANASNVFHTHSNIVPNSEIHPNVNNMANSSSPPPSMSSLSSHQSNLLPTNISNSGLAPNNPTHLNLSSGSLGPSGLNSNLSTSNIGLNNSSGGIPQDPASSLLAGSMGDQTGYPNSRQSQDGSNDDQYDLLGLLKVLKMTNLNLNILAFGTDLTTLGMIILFRWPLNLSDL